MNRTTVTAVSHTCCMKTSLSFLPLPAAKPAPYGKECLYHHTTMPPEKIPPKAYCLIFQTMLQYFVHTKFRRCLVSTGWIITIVVIVVITAILAVLYFLGKKAQKKQNEQQALMEENKQTVSMLIIDKKRMKMKDSGLPQIVIDQTPKLMRGSKLPIVCLLYTSPSPRDRG